MPVDQEGSGGVMLREDLVFVGTCDIAGLVRGKGFPSAELPARRKVGIGWTHSNLMQTCFGPILDTPFGTSGDLMIVPDPSSEVHVDFRDGSAPEHFFLGDIRNTDGTLGLLRSRVPAAGDRCAEGRLRPGTACGLRTGVRLYRRRGRSRSCLQLERFPAAGSVRRNADGGHPCGKRPARPFSPNTVHASMR